MEPLSSLVQLIKLALDLLGRSDEEARRFVANSADPIHREFEKLYQDHLRTFERTRDMLLAAGTPASDILQFVRGRALLEQGQVEYLAKLRSIQFHAPTSDLGRDFQEYIDAVVQCILSPQRPDCRDSVMYYASLHGLAEHLSARPDPGRSTRRCESWTQ
jgi:hypothetical protein